MSITVLADVILPNNVIAAGVRGKNMRRNDRVESDSGIQSINIGWTSTLREYEVGIVPMQVKYWQTIEALFEITEGGAFGMLMEDPKDSRVTSGGVFEVDENGFYQLLKRYTDPVSGRTKDRKITRPKGTILVYENGTLTSAAVSPLDGKATIAGSPDVETLSWTGAFYVPVHFMNDYIEWQIVAPGPFETRYAEGPAAILQEIRE
jgi:uncharacterized protein (TIGR02217 family)